MNAVIFDMDYTLLDREHAIVSVARAQFAPYFPEPAALNDAIKAFVDRDRAGFGDRSDVYEHVAEVVGVPLPIPKLVQNFDDCAWSFARLFDGVGVLLGTLRARGIRSGILTNGSAHAQNAKLDAVGLKNIVDTVFIAGERDVWKPDPAAFRSVCNDLGTTPAMAVMVGDSPADDLIPAQRLGMRTIWVRSHHPWPDEGPPQCTVEVQNIAAAGDVLLGWTKKE